MARTLGRDCVWEIFSTLLRARVVCWKSLTQSLTHSLSLTLAYLQGGLPCTTQPNIQVDNNNSVIGETQHCIFFNGCVWRVPSACGSSKVIFAQFYPWFWYKSVYVLNLLCPKSCIQTADAPLFSTLANNHISTEQYMWSKYVKNLLSELQWNETAIYRPTFNVNKPQSIAPLILSITLSILSWKKSLVNPRWPLNQLSV